MEWIINNMVIFWICVAVLFAVIEGFTLGMVTVWFSIGGIGATITALANGSILLQIVVFLVLSVVLLIFTRPILVKRLKLGHEKNYSENLEGKVGLVKEPIEPHASGLVKLNGIDWTAIGEEKGFSAAVGEEVRVCRVEGVKLIVEKVPDE